MDNKLIDLKDHKYYRHSVVNSKTIAIHHHKINVHEKLKDTNDKAILSLTLGGKYTINVGDKFRVKLTDKYNTYPVNHILRHSDSIYHFCTHLLNKTSKYILPCFGRSKLFFSYNEYFVNAYLDTDDEDYVYLLYRFFANEHYKEIENNITSHVMYNSTIDINNEYVLHRYKLPEDHKKDVLMMCKGQYSKFSKSLKSKIIKFHRAVNKSDMYGVIHKTDILRKKLSEQLGLELDETVELESRPLASEEFFNKKIHVIC